MKAVLQNMKTGRMQVDEVPPPALRPGGILVRVRSSLISLGTERAVIALANKGLIGKALDRPDLFRKVWNKAMQEGFWGTYQVVRNLMESPIPLGYSCAGEVIAVGQAAAEFRAGDRVACAGLNYANHAEVDYVPRNLAARVPEGLSFADACFVTVGAIAMQGTRLAEITLGERVVVMGLGLVGQIVAQLARCAGATVLATDPDPAKVELAARLGAHRTVTNPAELAGAVNELTGGHGADAVLVCAATKSDEPLRQAAALSRLRGRVVVVGDVGMNLERRPYFEKEVTLVVSRSYGPGRYDPAYEAHGQDYPLPYVRWTEGRNMQSFLELAARGEVKLQPLVTHRFPIDRAEAAYEVVTGKRPEPAIAILLEYPGASPLSSRVDLPAPPQPRAAGQPIRLGVIGAGQFAKGVLLPAFARQKGVQLGAFCTASGVTSKDVARRYGAGYCTADPREIIDDAALDGVVIATRHDQHAPLTAAALRAGKAAFVEKPLALTEESLEELCACHASAPAPRVLAGFNRRFSPLAVRCREFFAGAREPLAVFYRVNAGSLPADSWVADPVEGGGRVLGEVCHFIDTICYLTGALPRRVYAERLPGGGAARAGEGVTVTLRLADDSVGVVHYSTGGDPSVPKEHVEVFGGGRTAVIDNYRCLSLHRDNRRRRHRWFNQAKGHLEEVTAFVGALASGGPMPVDWQTLVAVTRTAFLVVRSLETGAPVDCEFPTPGQGGAAQP